MLSDDMAATMETNYDVYEAASKIQPITSMVRTRRIYAI
jgi:hypothetical protein